MRHIWVIILACLFVSALCAQTAAPAKVPVSITLPDASKLPSSPGYFVVNIKVTTGGQTLPMAFGLFLPPAYFKGNEPLPLILSLHNKGLESNDGRGLEFEGLGAICARDAWDDRNAAATTRPANAMNLRTDAKFIAVMPQCYPGMSFALSPMPEIIAETIKEVSKAYRVDSRRIYLTGFSYGGTSTWQLAEAMPNQFAAIVPIAGRATAAPAITAATLKDVGVYLACGTADGMLPQVRAMRDALAAAGHARMVYREIMDGTHWCYAVVYTDPEFWQWLLAQTRKPAQ